MCHAVLAVTLARSSGIREERRKSRKEYYIYKNMEKPKKILQENKKNEIFSQNKNQGFERCKPWFFVVMMF